MYKSKTNIYYLSLIYAVDSSMQCFNLIFFRNWAVESALMSTDS